MEKNQKKIINFYHRAKRMPGYQEIMRLTGLKSKNAVFKLIGRMVAANFVEKDSRGKIIPKHIFGETKILGVIEAGFPSPAEEELIDTITIDEYLIKNKEATYMLKVSGDSMIDAGIRPGDIVLAERGRQPRNGDIVIAEVDGNWTMKYLRKQGNRDTLFPGNKKYKPIVPENELNVAAVVTAVVRKYR
ncbi:MAG: translesion error-prone DNA polymerase V autoproteolytic subunit [Candidatus Moranbacteria bacterium]|nr:translesion error-prone DNA polymerase V autoproteolytic subunit [Candidatus Moranbacteria bacterium]